MKILVRLFQKVILLVCLVSVLMGLTASPSWADDCGTEDRVAVPKCVYYGTAGGWWVRNECNHPVTLKWDQSGSDHRQTFAVGEYDSSIPEAKDESRTRLSCCPRYNSCEDVRM